MFSNRSCESVTNFIHLPTYILLHAFNFFHQGANVYDVDTEKGMRPMRTLRNDLVNVWLKRNKIKVNKCKTTFAQVCFSLPYHYLARNPLKGLSLCTPCHEDFLER